MPYDRYYTKEKYESTYGAFFCGGAFLTVAIVSLVLLTLNINFISLSSWGYWLFIPAFLIIFFGGFQQLYTNMKFKKAIRNAILDRGQGTVKLEDLALEVGIKPNDVLRVLVDLRSSGLITYKFNAQTGEIILGESIQYNQAENYVAPPKKLQEPLPTEGKNFCVYCGNKIREGANFCENCGSSIH
ncbi:MAG: zinc-ribbon domain-containing protein [Promethearchaeota archaeon]